MLSAQDAEQLPQLAILKLLKINYKNRPRMEVAFGNSQCVVNVDQIELPREIRTAVVHLSAADINSEIVRTNGALLTLFALHTTRATCSYLQIFTCTTRMIRETFAVTLLNYTGRALYFSKNNGRNQLTFFEDRLSAGVTTIKGAVPSGISYF